MPRSALNTAPRMFRAPVATPAPGTPDKLPAVDRAGGMFQAGLIRRASIITRGEALGYSMWIDAEMLTSVADAINASAKGAKVRFTHPGLSGDGMGKFLGRTTSASVEGDRVLADVHFSAAGHRTPDGDLADYVMGLAEADPEAFGISISFQPDYQAEHEFVEEHGGWFDEYGNLRDFVSPDPDNKKNLMHVRLEKLTAADVVDQPAANPDGLFHRGQDVAQEADELLSYALGLSNKAPALSQFDVHPDRVSGFVQRFLNQHGLQVVPKETDMETPTDSQAKPSGEAETKPDPATAGEQTGAEQDTAQGQGEDQGQGQEKPNADASESQATATDGEAQTQTEAGEGTSEGAGGQLSAKPGQRFLDTFGDKGGVWFAQGLSFEEAQAKYVEELKAENAALRARVGTDRGEEQPVGFQAAPHGDADELAKLTRAFGGDAARAQRVLEMRAKRRTK